MKLMTTRQARNSIYIIYRKKVWEEWIDFFLLLGNVLELALLDLLNRSPSVYVETAVGDPSEYGANDREDRLIRKHYMITYSDRWSKPKVKL